ncbi:MAG: GrpB family protein [Pelomonas sp.]|nr:GrpB family protein [Roseateles sp.]
MKLFSPSQYQGVASQVVEEIKREVERLIPESRVEHVGSSAIPGAVSKGDIDICVIVPALRHPSAVATLESAGYVAKIGTLRTPDLCMLQSPRTDCDVALQVIASGSRFEFFMDFRDALRNSPALVQKYNEVKQSSAGAGPDEYRSAKSDFIAAVLQSAKRPIDGLGTGEAAPRGNGSPQRADCGSMRGIRSRLTGCAARAPGDEMD